MRVSLICTALLFAAACHPTTRSGEPTPKATFRGYATCDFEGSAFLACGSNVPFWLDCHGPSMEKVLDVMAACEVGPCSVAGVYVELEGDLSPEGHHGHLGLYQRELTPKHVHYASGVGPAQCGWAPRDKWSMAEGLR